LRTERHGTGTRASGARAAVPRDHAVFLRGISNVPMEPLRLALTRLGLTGVRSFGASGNFVFCAPDGDVRSLEGRISQEVGVDAFVRTREELESMVANDPYRDRAGAGVFIAERRLEASHLRTLADMEFEGAPPVSSGSTVYFVHPTRRRGRKGIIDFEKELGLRGTMRASRVVARVLDVMQ